MGCSKNSALCHCCIEFADVIKQPDLLQGSLEQRRIFNKIKHEHDLGYLQIDEKRISKPPFKKSLNYFSQEQMPKRLDQHSTFKQCCHIIQDRIVHTHDELTVSRHDPVAAQLNQFQKRLTICVVIPETTLKSIQVDVQQGCLKNVSEQNVAGHGAVAEQIDQIALGMPRTGQIADAEVCEFARLFHNTEAFRMGGEHLVPFER